MHVMVMGDWQILLTEDEAHNVAQSRRGQDKVVVRKEHYVIQFRGDAVASDCDIIAPLGTMRDDLPHYSALPAI